MISVLSELAIGPPEHFAIVGHSTLVLLVQFQPCKPIVLAELANTVYLMALATFDLLQNLLGLDCGLHRSLTAFAGPQDVEVGPSVVQKSWACPKLIRLEQAIDLT